MDTTTSPANDTHDDLDLDLIIYFDDAHDDVTPPERTGSYADELAARHDDAGRCDACGHDEDDATFHPYCPECHDGLACTTPETVAAVRAAHARVCGGDAAYDGSDGESGFIDAREE